MIILLLKGSDIMKRRIAIIFILIVPMLVYMLHNFVLNPDDKYLYKDKEWLYIYEHQNEYPSSLITLAKNNKEALSFVYEYKDHKEQAIDIKKEINNDKMPLFLQWDQRWGYLLYGDDYIAVQGCGPTCMSMVGSYLKKNENWNPYFMAQYAYQNGYLSDVGTSWDFMLTGARRLGLEVEELSVNEMIIKDRLQKGYPIICSMSKGIFTSTGHFIVLREYKDGKIYVNDPNSYIKSQKGYEFDDIKNQIKNLWCYH